MQKNAKLLPPDTYKGAGVGERRSYEGSLADDGTTGHDLSRILARHLPGTGRASHHINIT